MPKPLKTFICYAREDRDAVDDLRKHLKQAERKELLEIWDDGEILAGQDWDKAIKIRLEKARLILLFISVDFINSEYIEKTELQEALQRHRDGKATLIPIIVRRCDWQEYFGIGQFQALPKEARPIKSVELSIREEIYYEVAQGIKIVAQELKARIDLEAERAAALVAEEASRLRLEKEEQARAERQRVKDEAAWKAAGELDTIEAYEDYLDKGYTRHASQAHERIGALEEADARRRAEQRAKEKAEAEEKRKQEEAKRRAKEAAAEKKRKEDADRKRLETEEAQKRDPFAGLMVPIKGGAFDMGDTFGTGISNEKPVHRVIVNDFHLCKYPVTQAQWKQIMGDNPSSFKGDDLPVENVSWNEVQKFIEKLNEKTGQKYRLPTEAEWEFAARGGNQSKGFAYAGSHDFGEVAWHAGNSGSKTHPVGKKKPNELGLFDMSGNVWEWCLDWYAENYYKNGPEKNPTGPDSGSNRVLRGGSWGDGAGYCRVSRRNRVNPFYRHYNVGFRPARTVTF